MRQEHSESVQEQRIVIYIYIKKKLTNELITITHNLHLSVKPFHDKKRKVKAFCDRKGSALHVVYSQSQSETI